MTAVPGGLAWWRERPGGAAWLERLPRLVAECAERWELAVGVPFEAHRVSPTTAVVPARPWTGEPASIAYVAPVTRADGTPAVLKVNFPEPESEHEAAALAHWAAAGAVRLLADDSERRALLVERCEPGAQLWSVADEEEANRAAAAVLRRLWRPVPREHPFRTLDAEARRWATELPPRWDRHRPPQDRTLLDRAIGWIDELLASPGEAVVLHQDLHGGNVLSAAREPFLAIDPKPLVGERSFDVASLVRDRRDELAVDPWPARRIRRRLDQLTAELELDRERTRRWAVVHALAWGLEADDWEPEMIACAAWLAAA